MKIISHRGNINGSQPNKENSLNYINEAIESGYNVEIDMWLQNDNLFLGHDAPEWQIDPQFLKSNYAQLWIHCKNDAAFFICDGLKYSTYFTTPKKILRQPAKILLW